MQSKTKISPKPSNLTFSKSLIAKQNKKSASVKIQPKTKSAKSTKVIQKTKHQMRYENLSKSNASFHAEIIDSIKEYNLTAERIMRNGESTNTQLIVKNDKVVHHFTETYQVLANEEAFKIAKLIRESHGLIFDRVLLGEQVGHDVRGLLLREPHVPHFGVRPDLLGVLHPLVQPVGRDL